LAHGRERLDRLLVERGLARSRERAQALILAGVVRVDGRPGGIVREPRLHVEALARVGEAASVAGFGVRAACASPLSGAEGNREFFLHLVAGGEGLGAAEREALIGRIVHGTGGPASAD